MLGPLLFFVSFPENLHMALLSPPAGPLSSSSEPQHKAKTQARGSLSPFRFRCPQIAERPDPDIPSSLLYYRISSILS